MKVATFAVAVISIATFAFASEGQCKFEPGQCSCKVGEANEGLCWDKIVNPDPAAPLKCIPRACKRGWTCSCAQRTHLCQVKNFDTLVNTGASVPINSIIASQVRMLTSTGSRNPQMRKASRMFVSSQSGSSTSELERTCIAKPVEAANLPYIELGDMTIGISRTGTQANQCTNVDIYLNGGLVESYLPEADMSGKSVDALIASRARHTLLEMRAGDLIAFHFKQASYHCYEHFTDLRVNRLSTNSTANNFETRFARTSVQDWEKKNLASSFFSDAETAENLGSFVPLRIKQLSGAQKDILPGVDMWDATSDEDNKVGDFFFRIQIPATLPDPDLL